MLVALFGGKLLGVCYLVSSSLFSASGEHQRWLLCSQLPMVLHFGCLVRYDGVFESVFSQRAMPARAGSLWMMRGVGVYEPLAFECFAFSYRA